MPHAFADVRCSCGIVFKYHSYSHDKDGHLTDFICPHFRSSVIKRVQAGWLIGFDQLAGLYFDITCLNCNAQKKFQFEAKTFGEENDDAYFKCCGSSLLSFHFYWSH